MGRSERPDEVLARRIVADVLGVEVTQHDDNSRPSMVDAMIHLDGTQIPLEVVRDVRPDVMEQSAQLSRYQDGIPLSFGSTSWLAMMRRGSRPSRLASQLPPLFADLSPGEDLRRVPAALAALGVIALDSFEGDGPPRVYLVGQGVSWSGAGPNLNRYVETFLEKVSDVPYKLVLAAGSGRAHVFIWLSIGSSYSGWAGLRSEESTLPETAPNLPPGVTDVWLALPYVGKRVVRYSPESGWVRTDREIREDDEAVLYKG